MSANDLSAAASQAKELATRQKAGADAAKAEAAAAQQTVDAIEAAPIATFLEGIANLFEAGAAAVTALLPPAPAELTADQAAQAEANKKEALAQAPCGRASV